MESSSTCVVRDGRAINRGFGGVRTMARAAHDSSMVGSSNRGSGSQSSHNSTSADNEMGLNAYKPTRYIQTWLRTKFFRKFRELRTLPWSRKIGYKGYKKRLSCSL